MRLRFWRKQETKKNPPKAEYMRCQSCGGALPSEVPLCRFCGKRRRQLLKLNELVETLKFAILIVAILVIDAVVILYVLSSHMPIYVPVIVIPACIVVSALVVSRIRSRTFQFWVAFFHRYDSLRRALFLFAFYVFFLAFLWIILPTVQPLLPETLQPYTLSFAASALAFIFAGALWLNLRATCRAWTLITSDEKELTIDKDRVAFYSATLVLIVGGAIWITETLRTGDTTQLSFILAVLIAIFIGEYFLWHLLNVAWKLFGSELYVPYSQDIFDYAWFATPQRIRAGGSSTVEAQITPLHQEKTNSVDTFLEVEVQSAGLKWGSEQKQKKRMNIGDDTTLYYAWNCQFPDAGDHTIDVHCRIRNVYGIKQETFFSRRVEVTRGRSTFLLALLPVIYGAFNVGIALKQAGII